MAAAINQRETSLRAFEEIKREGILGAVQWQVYELVFREGPMTAREITRYFELYERSIAITTFQPRLRELEEMGVMRRVGERACHVTGRSAYAWDVTSHVPTEEERQRGKGGAKKPVAFLEDKERLHRLFLECEWLYNEGGRSEDFFHLVSFLSEDTL